MNTQIMNEIVNGHSFVDLGLPSGLLWATCNVGADSPEQAGLYFAGDEVKGYTAEQVADGERKFDYQSYSNQLLRSTLAPQEDAAHANMGGKWRMPTKEEFQELIDNCTSEWTEDYNGTGVAGRLFTSKTNGNSVFFPAAGLRDNINGSLIYVSLVGYYWSASPRNNYYGHDLDLDSSTWYWGNFSRSYGFPVRAVLEE